MTPDELNRLEAELNAAREVRHLDFEHWYDTAANTTVADYCETGWLLWRVLMAARGPVPTNTVEASVQIEGKGGQSAG